MPVKFRINFKKLPCKPESEDSFYENGLFFKGNNGSTVILIHGLTGTPNEMKFLANFLNKKGYSVICPRLANHGRPLEILKTTPWQEFYQTAKKALDEADAKAGFIFVAGLSMGALLALLLAEEFPDKIAGAICLSPTIFYDGWNAPWYQCFIPLVSWNFLKYSFYFKEDPPYGIKNEEIRKLVDKYYSTASLDDMNGVARYGYPYFPVALLHQQHLLAKYLSRKLKDIRVPVQFIQAKDDDVTSPKNSQFIYDRIKSEIKEIVLLYNSYHVITADQEREKVAEELERFIRKCVT